MRLMLHRGRSGSFALVVGECTAPAVFRSPGMGEADGSYNDVLESNLASEMENGRLVRLMAKINFVVEREGCVLFQEPQSHLAGMSTDLADSRWILVGLKRAIGTSSSYFAITSTTR